MMTDNNEEQLLTSNIGKQMPGRHSWTSTAKSMKEMVSPSFFSVESTLKRHAEYGPVYEWKVMGYKLVFVNDPLVIQYVFRQEDKLVQQMLLKSTRETFGTNHVSGSTGKKHQFYRRILNSRFTLHSIAELLPTIVKTTKTTIGGLLNADGTAGRMNNIELDLKRHTFDVAFQAVVGENRVENGPPMHQVRDKFLTMLAGMFALPIDLGRCSSFGRGKIASKWLRDYVTKQVEEAIKAVNVGDDGEPQTFNSVLEVLLGARDPETGDELTKEELAANCQSLLLNAHDTTASTLCSLMLALVNRPDILSALQAEQTEFVEKHGTDNYTMEALKDDMPFADSLINDVLRVFPTVVGMFRTVLKDFYLPGYGYRVSKNSVLLLGLPLPHHWENPQDASMDVKHVVKRLDPWKFPEFLESAQSEAPLDSVKLTPEEQVLAKANKKKSMKRSDAIPTVSKKPGYFPFGQGSRGCLGQHLARTTMKVFLAELARTGLKVGFENSKGKKVKCPPWSTFPNLVPAEPISLVLEK